MFDQIWLMFVMFEIAVTKIHKNKFRSTYEIAKFKRSKT